MVKISEEHYYWKCFEYKYREVTEIEKKGEIYHKSY